MDTLFFLYGVIIIVLLVGAFFIIYHILRYSLNDALGRFGATLFGAVFLFLLVFNFFSFQAIEAESVVPIFEINSLLEDASPALVPTKNNPW